MSRPVDYIPPTVTLTSPVSGTATGNVTITANAHDDQGVGSVKFFVDGQAYGPLDQAAPFTTSGVPMPEGRIPSAPRPMTRPAMPPPPRRYR
jgi:hypothetical protein